MLWKKMLVMIKKDNEKEVASLKYPTPVDTELGAVDDNNDNVKK